MENFKLEKFCKEQHLDLILDFCKQAHKDVSQPAHVNMWGEGKNTLPYILSNTNRFTEPTGSFYFLRDNDTIIGCSGIHTSDFSNKIAIAGSRMWIHSDYRNKTLPREYFLPAQKEWAIKNNFDAIALTFNEYNKNMIKLWQRMRLGEKRSERQPKHIFYNNLNEVEFPVVVHYTKQWIIYEKLKEDFIYDWNKIKSQ